MAEENSGFELPFVKMHGAGNDFVVLDALRHALPADFDFASVAQNICRRHFGVGADGLLLLEKPEYSRAESSRAEYSDAAVRMRMWNPDGSEDHCGNGLRCVARLAHERGYVSSSKFTVQTLAGLRAAEILPDGLVRVAMGQPNFDLAAIPMTPPEIWVGNRALEYSLPVGGEILPNVSTLSTGTVHTVIFLDEPLSGERFERLSPLIEHHAWFPERTSIMWARVEDEHHLQLHIWERGAGETLACGTGACASAVAAQITKRASSPIHVRSRGGVLSIEWQPGGEIFMTGPAVVVYEGKFLEG